LIEKSPKLIVYVTISKHVTIVFFQRRPYVDLARARSGQGYPAGKGKARRNMGKKLTKRTVDAIPPGTDHGTWYVDADLPGFVVVSYASGEKVFFVRYRAGARRRVIKVGRYGSITAKQARKRAKELLAEAELGTDPAEEKARQRAMPTLASWVKTYLERVQLKKKRPEEDVRYLRIACERWGSRPLDAVTREDIDALRTSVAKSHKITANRLLASISACFSSAVGASPLTCNPATGLKPFPENPPRDRVLTHDERKALVSAIAQEEDVHARGALMLLIATGARRSEVLRARWEDLDLSSNPPMWRIPSPKSGKVQAMPLPPNAAKMLQTLPRTSVYVVAGRLANTPEGTATSRPDIKGPWRRALQRAGLLNSGIHVHDLRRDFGRRVYREDGLIAASRLLRHRDVRVTSSVYAPESMRDLGTAVARREAEVLPFPKTSRRRSNR
jgi:integrase